MELPGLLQKPVLRYPRSGLGECPQPTTAKIKPKTRPLSTGWLYEMTGRWEDRPSQTTRPVYALVLFLLLVSAHSNSTPLKKSS